MRPAGDTEFVLFPEAHDQLRTSLVNVLLPYDQEAGERSAEYADCMADRNFDVQSPAELFELVSAEFAKVSRAEDGYPDTEAFTHAETFETRAASADSQCRADIYYDALSASAGAVQDWQDAHSAALAELDHEWAKWVTAAQNYPEARRVLS